jgi:hypothetical protein
MLNELFAGEEERPAEVVSRDIDPVGLSDFSAHVQGERRRSKERWVLGASEEELHT